MQIASPDDVAVHLLVNERKLTDLVADFERSRGWDVVGGYDWISMDGLVPPLARLNATADDWPRDGKVVLLTCAGCLEEGCWPLLARVIVSDAVVQWRDFEQPHRADRDYSDFSFEFESDEYQVAVASAFADQHPRP